MSISNLFGVVTWLDAVFIISFIWAGYKAYLFGVKKGMHQAYQEDVTHRMEMHLMKESKKDS